MSNEDPKKALLQKGLPSRWFSLYAGFSKFSEMIMKKKQVKSSYISNSDGRRKKGRAKEKIKLVNHQLL